ncbi:hypothetical protein KL905_003193 [Ogataea polymorpha]|uniref:RRM domain-containing protein n=1 Tax=Ogataea polymorpha TaxID=460523 RepID=A0A9P8TGJ0_9ASCO|nr:hypothetical protein KL937_003171 [Ogataea polymorpha]KAG7892472.1 hypothetical protein KL908_003424 [Ogataea polymorpha]KAG7909248.1 hypothetical protein KL906_002742 [Ogataea polymorpha]KAG7916018.1 hypothetical protein KL927_003483 [Ogataea polymorpha]KAG7920559.1 hypothetical protein KL905_003193 [Ogataea polymorpha]
MTDKQPAAEGEDQLDRRTLFVQSIPVEATKEQLNEFFSQYAPVRHSVIVTDTEGKSRGFGFVSFVTDEDALSALKETKKAKFMNKLLRVSIAKRRQRKDKNDKQAKPVEDAKFKSQEISLKKSAKLIVRNLPWSVKDPNELVKVFLKFGKVKEAHIPKKKDGKMSGFGFVTMMKHAAAEKAVKETVGLKLQGREVAVDFAIDKSKWEEFRKEKSAEGEEDEEDEDEKSEDEEEEEEEEGQQEDGDEEEDEEKEEKEENKADDSEDDESDSDGEDLNFKRPRPNKQENFSIFVRNVPYDATRESLEEHFSKFGPIKYALPVMDKDTQLAKGSAFVAFRREEDYEDCLLNAPEVNPNSMLIPDDVSPLYVYEGRVLQITATVDRDSAARIAERNALARKELLGRVPTEKDKRNLFLLNEGRITSGSRLASLISKTDLDVREKSYNLRVQQLNKNPSLHLSLTRLAIRNLPRAMNEKALKALGRKAIVQFASEVKEGKRQPLNKEELARSQRHKEFIEEKLGVKPEDKKRKKQTGVVKQAKIINEVKGSGVLGRSRGYGFLEFRDHKHALMALRWLNAHEVSREDILVGLTEEQKKVAESEGTIAKRRLIVEFAIENAKVVKRRHEQIAHSKAKSHRKDREGQDSGRDRKRQREGGDKKDANGRPKDSKRRKTDTQTAPETSKSGLPNDVKRLIGFKRKRRHAKK